MNIPNLILLRNQVAKRDPEKFDQDRYQPGEDGCNCAFLDCNTLFGSLNWNDAVCVLGITNEQYWYIFGSKNQIRRIAKWFGLPIPDSFGPVDAAARIQQVMDGLVICGPGSDESYRDAVARIRQGIDSAETMPTRPAYRTGSGLGIRDQVARLMRQLARRVLRLYNILILIVIAGYAIVDTMAFYDELAARSKYCEYVEQGVWPDYRHIAEYECD